VINPYSEVDQFVALPQGVYGFVFRGRPVELSLTPERKKTSTTSVRDAVIVPPHTSDEGKHKPAKAVVNAMFPKGTSRRKTAQKIAKAAINPDVCGLVRSCDRRTNSFDSASSPLFHDQILFDDDEIDTSNAQLHVQSASIQSREYLCAVSTASEAESWVVALRWAAERRRMYKEQKRIDQRFNSLGIGGDDKLIITGTTDDRESSDVVSGDYGRGSKESLASEGSWCKTETIKKLADQIDGERFTKQVVPNNTIGVLEKNGKESSALINSFSIVEDDLAGHSNNTSKYSTQDNAKNEATFQPTPKAKNLLDSLLSDVSKEAAPTKLFEEEQEDNAGQINDGAVIVITKVCKFQLRHNLILSQSIPIPLPCNPLDIIYEIELLLLKNCTGELRNVNTTNSAALRPESIEEQTILRSAQDIFDLIKDLKEELCNGDIHDNELSDVSTYQFLHHVESSLWSGLNLRKKTTTSSSVSTTFTDIISISKGVDSTVESVNRVMRSLSTHSRVCSSQHFQQFLCLDSSTKDESTVKKRLDLSGGSVDQIVKYWLSINKTRPILDTSQLYLAVTMHHPIAGPVLFLTVLWSSMRFISIFWYLMTKSLSVISIPLESYATIIAAAFYFGHGVGMRRQTENNIFSLISGKLTHKNIHDNATTAIPSELVNDDDHSTLVDENSDTDETLIFPEFESIAPESSALPSPLPKFPENKGLSCWSSPNHNLFKVRSISYLKDRLKLPSDPPVFQCRGVDIWLTDNAERNISRHPAMLGGKLHEEDTFIVNFLLPFANLVAYFSVKPVNQMPPNVARVWQAFVNGDQEYRDGKLKLLPVVVEGPWIVKKAVGPGTSPAMVGRDLPLQYYFTEPTATKKGIYEVDVLVTASRIARGILNVVKGHTKSLTIAFAFIIEAAEQVDLPENVLCAFQVHSMDLEACPRLPEYSLGDICD